VIDGLLKMPESQEGKEDEDLDFSKIQYMSKNKNHAWKRRDVAMILMGLFIEDIQMYCIRN
jgi:hypothetical protein